MERLLIIRAGAVGDCLLLLPLLQSLRHHYPQAYIALMGYPARLSLLLAYADAISSIERSGMETFFQEQAPLDPALSRYFSQFDLILSYRHDPEGLFTRNLCRTGARQVISHPPFPPPHARLHLIDHYLQPLERLQVPVVSRLPCLPLSPHQQERAATLWQQYTLLRKARSVVVLHPGSGGREKCWPASHFAALADRLVRQQGVTILCLPGPADQEVMQEFRAALQTERVVIVEGLDLETVAGVLGRVTLYVGNDSGMTHLAAAVGVPTLAIMGRTDPQRWGPRGRRVCLLTLPPDYPSSRSPWEYFSLVRVYTAAVTLLSPATT